MTSTGDGASSGQLEHDTAHRKVYYALMPLVPLVLLLLSVLGLVVMRRRSNDISRQTAVTFMAAEVMFGGRER